MECRQIKEYTQRMSDDIVCENVKCRYHKVREDELRAGDSLTNQRVQACGKNCDVMFEPMSYGNRYTGLVCLTCAARCEDACAICLNGLMGTFVSVQSHGGLCGRCVEDMACGPALGGAEETMPSRLYEAAERLHTYDRCLRRVRKDDEEDPNWQSYRARYGNDWRLMVEIAIAWKDNDDIDTRNLRRAIAPLVKMGAKRVHAIMVVYACAGEEPTRNKEWEPVAAACHLAYDLIGRPVHARVWRSIDDAQSTESDTETSEDSGDDQSSCSDEETPRAKKRRRDTDE